MERVMMERGERRRCLEENKWRRLSMRSNTETTTTIIIGGGGGGVEWMLMTIVILILMLPIFVAQGIKGDGEEEFCQWEVFQADCAGDDEVLLMTKAVYGRMRQGRCIQRDFGYVNCGMDALDAVSLLCSARRTCSFAVTILHGNHQCPIDLTGYLVARYICLKVTQCKPSYCLRSETVKVPSSGGYLSAAKPQSAGGGAGGGGAGGGGGGPSLGSEGHCGTLNCPWTLEANPGQRINLTLLDFSADLIKIPDGIPSGAPAGSICYRYASVRDGNLTKDLTGCGKEGQGTRGGGEGGGSGRRRSVYLSESHVVQITIYTSHTNNVHFLIRYQTSGCASIQAPENSRLRHVNDELIVECLYSDRNWKLRCNGSTWIGGHGGHGGGGGGGACDSPVVTNQNDLKVNVAGGVDRNRTSSLGVIIVVGLGIVIGIIIGFGMLVFLTCCIRRSNRHSNGASSQVGSPVYWKTRSELVYHGSDLYHCDHHHAASTTTMSPPPPPPLLPPQSMMHDYSSWPPQQLLSSDAKTTMTTPSSFTATMLTSPHLVHLRHNHLLDCSGKRIDELTIVEPSKCQQQHQQQQLDHCNALKLKRDHVYELPRVQGDKVRQVTAAAAAAAITSPSGVDTTQGHLQGGGSEYTQRQQGSCTERNAPHSLTCM